MSYNATDDQPVYCDEPYCPTPVEPLTPETSMHVQSLTDGAPSSGSILDHLSAPRALRIHRRCFDPSRYREAT